MAVGRFPPRLSRSRIAIVVGALVGALLIPAGEFGPESAFGAARTQFLTNGLTVSVRSADGCRLKPLKFVGVKKYRRDYVCAFKGKLVIPRPFTPGAARVQGLVNGDTVTVRSADGCTMKPVKTPDPGKWRRDVLCTIKGTAVPPPVGGPGPVGQPPTAVTGGATWTPIFADDFNGTAVDTTKWNVPNNENFGSGNNEDQCYLRTNTTVAGGTLRLTGRRQTVTGCGTNPDGGNAYYFTSGMVTTRQQGGPLRFKFRHGYAEVRMRAPRGNIYWPAFWLTGALDGSSPGWPAYLEIDVSEIYGSFPDKTESNCHYAGGTCNSADHSIINPPSSARGVNINPPRPFVAGGAQSWHTYGLNWSSNRLQWYVDGVLIRTVNGTASGMLTGLGYEHSLILNLAMGGNGTQFDGYTGQDSAAGYNNGNLVADMPASMEIDYAKVWQP